MGEVKEEYPTTKQLRRIMKQACEKHSVRITYTKTREINYHALPFDQWSHYSYNARRFLRTIEYRLEFDHTDHYKDAMAQVEAWITLSGKKLRYGDRYYSPLNFRDGTRTKAMKIICTI